MSDSKIQIKVGHVEFSGEGNQEWLASQLDKILEKVPELLKIELRTEGNGNAGNQNDGANNSGNGGISKPANLPVFLKDKNATSNQTKKFLATAAYLQLNGRDSLSTNDITKALDDAKQGKLTNPALCLIGNTKKGYCDKRGKSFYVTPEGLSSLGITAE